MGAKKRIDTAAKEFKATVARLRSSLEKAETKAERLKSKVARLEKARTDLEAQVKKLTKRLEKAARPADQGQAPTAKPTAKPAVAPARSETPDATWTVVQLRTEARSRGILGLSSKSKADILAALAD